MALTLIAQPDKHHPVYNPVVWVFNSDESLTIGFRYLFNLYKYTETSTELIGQFRIAPDHNGNGQFDISKLLQSNINSIIGFNSEPVISVDNLSMCRYDIECIEEFTFYEEFTDYEFGGYWVRLPITSSVYNVGDLIYIQLDDQTITDSRAQLNGYHTVVTVTGTYIEIDVLFSSIGSGPLTPGKVYYADRRKVNGDSIYISDYIGYNGAIPFVDFPNWDETFVLPTNDEEPTGNILTNTPNYLKSYKDKDKFYIKTYQELYWNAFVNPVNDLEEVYVKSVIAQNNFGDRWIITDPSIQSYMKQFNISPMSGLWTSITPNYTNSGGYMYMMNPYTHINSDGSLSYAEYIDYWTTYADGYDSCDKILVDFTLTKTFGPDETFSYQFIPYATGLNGRRLYKGTIDARECYIFYNGVNKWFLNAGLGSGYSSVPKMTDNNTPYGISFATTNTTDAYKVFDGNENTYYQSTGVPSTITYGFSNGVFRNTAVVSYSLNKGYNPSGNRLPTHWRVQGSLDGGATWTTIHQVIGNTNQGIYNSPNIYNGVRYEWIRLVIDNVFSGTEVRVWGFEVFDYSEKAYMMSSNNCPTSGGFLYWTWDPPGSPNYPNTITSESLITTGIGDDGFPTLLRRRVYMDYTCGKNTAQLLFLDRQGSYSSFNFPLNIIENGTNDKLSYKNEIGGINSGQWTYNTYDSETKVYSSMVEKRYTLTTNWMNQGMSDYFEELISSPELYFREVSDGDEITPWVSCSVIDKDFVNPSQKNRKLINRTITVKLNSNNSINI